MLMNIKEEISGINIEIWMIVTEVRELFHLD